MGKVGSLYGGERTVVNGQEEGGEGGCGRRGHLGVLSLHLRSGQWNMRNRWLLTVCHSAN